MSYQRHDRHFRMEADDIEKVAPDRSVMGEVRDESGRLLYEGQLLEGKPFGTGRSYYPDGTVYQDGIFGVKGLMRGKEFYPDGTLRLDAVFRLNRAYGPNIPEAGKYYDREGTLVYEGKFPVRCGGVGYPTVEGIPGFGGVMQKEMPKDIPVFMWEDIDAAFGVAEARGKGR